MTKIGMKVKCDTCGKLLQLEQGQYVGDAVAKAGWRSIFDGVADGEKVFKHLCNDCQKPKKVSQATLLDKIMVPPDPVQTVQVNMTKFPSEEDWFEVKRRALVTVGKRPKNIPDKEWKHKILNARHSPIRHLQFSFDIVCPYWVSVHLCRHVHAQPFVKSQRNDRQSEYDRTKAPQDAPVSMIWDMNAEELLVICEKRLCNQASKETRDIVSRIKEQVELHCPEFIGLLEPPCKKGCKCREMYPCQGK